MASNPAVSIIMPAYNAARYIESAMESVLVQSFADWELLVANDASQDNTLELARTVAARDSRVRVFDMEKNGGVAAARNLALKQARGRYIAFLDSDDLWLPAKLEKQVAAMEAGGLSICYSYYQRIDENGRPLGEVRPPDEVGYQEMLKSNFIGNLTGVYDAESLGREYFTDFRHEDYVAWLALIKRAGSATAVPEVLARYRVYAGSTSSNKLRTLGWQWRIYRHNQALGFFRSCRLMLHYGLNALAKRRST